MDSFRSGMAMAGAYSPDEFSAILKVYREIASEPWFTQSPDKRQEFAVHMLNTYRGGIRSIEQFRFCCQAAAKVRFSQPPDSYPTMESGILVAR